MVLRGPRSLYHERVPTAAVLVLLVEVAFMSYAFDSGPGLREYASAGIAPYWIVNLPTRRFEVYSAPIPGGESYRSRQDYSIGEEVPIGCIASQWPMCCVKLMKASMP